MRCVLTICALIVLCTPAAAEDYPSRPIRLVLGFTAGGPTDIPARFLAEKLAASLGRPVVVENKPGAGAMLATLDVLSRPRDGHDLLPCTYFDAVNTLLYRNARYRLSDIVGISLIAKYSYAVAVSNSVPAHSLNEFIDYAKQNPGRVNLWPSGRRVHAQPACQETGETDRHANDGHPLQGHPGSHAGSRRRAH